MDSFREAPMPQKPPKAERVEQLKEWCIEKLHTDLPSMRRAFIEKGYVNEILKRYEGAVEKDEASDIATVAVIQVFIRAIETETEKTTADKALLVIARGFEKVAMDKATWKGRSGMLIASVVEDFLKENEGIDLRGRTKFQDEDYEIFGKIAEEVKEKSQKGQI